MTNLKPCLSKYSLTPKPRKAYAVVSYSTLEYSPSMRVHNVYSTREAAEKHLPRNNEWRECEIKEWEVLDD